MRCVRGTVPVAAGQAFERLREALELCGADDDILREAAECAGALADQVRALESVTNGES